MSKLMWIAGIVLIAAGVAFGAVNLVSLQPAAARISLDSSIILLVGGIVALGLGSVIDALHALRPGLVDGAVATAAVAGAVAGAVAASAEAETPVSEQPEAAADATEVEASTRDTLGVLEAARQKMEQAFLRKPDVSEAADTATPSPEEVAEAIEDGVPQEAVIEDEVTDEEAVIEDGQLYVVEERIIRLRPARILSDGTVEAETDEGWMRFENLEHLDEYLDAVETGQA